MTGIRLSGLSSGLPIDDWVSQLMKAQRAPVNKLLQKKQILEWQRDDYRSMNSLLMDLRSSALSMKLQGTYLTKSAVSANDSIVSVVSSGTATEGIYNIKINQLAEAASVTSGALGASNGSTTTLSQLGWTNSTGELLVGGDKGTVKITINNTDTISSLVNSVNSKSSITGVKMSYDATLDRFFFVSSVTGDQSKIQLESKDPSILTSVLKMDPTKLGSNNRGTITGTQAFTDKNAVIGQTGDLVIDYQGTGNPYKFSVTSTTTVGQLIDSINSSGLGQQGVTAYLDGNGKLAFSKVNDGKEFNISDSSGGTLLTALGLPNTTTTILDATYNTIGDKGQNALVEYNSVSGSYSSNTFSINGLTFTAKKAQASGDPAVTINVTKDVEAVFSKIKDFIDKYNDTIDKINKKISEPHYRDYQPLTDEQKKDMKEDDIKRWEEKAKSGLLRSDSILSSAMSDFRRALSDTVSGLPFGDPKLLSDIGITTGDWREQGKLHINEAKLRESLASNPEQVMRLFTADDGSKNTTAGDGVALRLYNKLNDVMDTLTKKAGAASGLFKNLDDSLMGKNIQNIDEDIYKVNSRLADLETRYYREFTAMEKAINQSNQQSSWLAQQFGGQA